MLSLLKKNNCADLVKKMFQQKREKKTLSQNRTERTRQRSLVTTSQRRQPAPSCLLERKPAVNSNGDQETRSKHILDACDSAGPTSHLAHALQVPSPPPSASDPQEQGSLSRGLAPPTSRLSLLMQNHSTVSCCNQRGIPQLTTDHAPFHGMPVSLVKELGHSS